MFYRRGGSSLCLFGCFFEGSVDLYVYSSMPVIVHECSLVHTNLPGYHAWVSFFFDTSGDSAPRASKYVTGVGLLLRSPGAGPDTQDYSLIRSLIFVVFSIIYSGCTQSQVSTIPGTVIVQSVICRLGRCFASFGCLVDIKLLVTGPVLSPTERHSLRGIYAAVALSCLSVENETLSPPGSVCTSSAVAVASKFT